MSDHLAHLVETAGNPRVLVVGDLMLDRYVWGETRRISGEKRFNSIFVSRHRFQHPHRS